jgi:hypothetical protein
MKALPPINPTLGEISKRREWLSWTSVTEPAGVDAEAADGSFDAVGMESAGAVEAAEADPPAIPKRHRKIPEVEGLIPIGF